MRRHECYQAKYALELELEDLRARLARVGTVSTTWRYEACVAFAAYLVTLDDVNITSNEEWMAARVEEFCVREGWATVPPQPESTSESE